MSFDQRGFTIIELVISLAIVAILTTVGVATFTNVNEVKQLKATAAQLAMRISEQRARAFSGQVVNEMTPMMFGVVVNNDLISYTLFADTDDDCNFNDSDQFMETVALPNKVTFTGAWPQKICYKLGELVNFTCRAKDECGIVDQMVFYLITKDGKNKQRVIVELQNGLARVQE